MGHFGAGPSGWPGSRSCLPALLLNYFGQGALLLQHPDAAEQPVLPAAPGLGASPAGGAGDGRGGHRLAGADLGRVLAHAAGGAARLLPARGDRPHVGDDARADLHSGGQLGADDRRASCWCWSSARRATLAAAYGIAVTATMAITTILFVRGRARALGLEPVHAPARGGALPRRRPRPSSAPTSSRSCTAAGSRWPWRRSSSR